jgi:uncharacterized membrane protein (DUF485 family)
MKQPKKPANTMKQAAEDRKFRLALIMFTVYAVGYTAFTIAGTMTRGVLSIRVAGVNLGILSGMLIIASAILIAVVYNWYSGKMEAV